MMNETGTGRIEYEDVMRAIGYYIDQNNLREICIIELQEGLLLRAVRYTSDRSGYQAISESFLFTNEDIERLVEEAYQRRLASERRSTGPLQNQQGQQGQQGQQQPPQRGWFGR